MAVELPYINLLLIGFSAFLFVYCIGHVFVSALNLEYPKSYFAEFIRILSGMLMVTFFYSVIRTSFFTVNCLLLFFLFYLVFYLKNIRKFRFDKSTFLTQLLSINYKTILLCFVLFTCAFTLVYANLKSMFHPVYYQLNNDFYCNATNVEILNKYGIETMKSNFQFLNETVRTVYHFGELWFAAFFSKLFAIKPIFSLLLILFPIAIVAYVLGFAALISNKKNHSTFKLYFFSVLFLFVSGIAFYIPKESILTHGEWFVATVNYHTNFNFHIKISYIVIILLLGANLVKRKHYDLFFCTFLLLPILNTSVASTIYVGANLFLFYLLLTKQFTRSQYFKTQIFIVFNFLCLAGYMYLISVTNSKSSATIPIKFGVESFNLSYLRTFINCIIGQTFKLIVSNIIIVFLLAYLYFKKIQSAFKDVLWMLLIVNISGILMFAVFHIMIDAIQLWAAVCIPTVAIFSTLILWNFAKIKSKITTGIIAVLTVLFLYNYYQDNLNAFYRKPPLDTKFIEKVNHSYKRDAQIASLSSSSDLTSIFLQSVDIISPAMYVRMYMPEYNPVSLSSFEIPIDTTSKIIEMGERQIQMNTVFYKYVQQQKSKNTFVDLNSSQVQFIKTYNIGYLITTQKAMISPQISAMIKEQFADKYGNKFIVLKKN